MRILNISEAKSQLSRLVNDAARGTDSIICRNGNPVARITALEAGNTPIRFGVMKHRIKVAADFNVPLPDAILDSFEGRRYRKIGTRTDAGVLLARLRKYRGRLPADFKVDRLEADER